MKTIRALAVCALLALAAPAVHAAVKTEEKSQMQFEGGLGKMMSIFARSAQKPMTDTVAVKGNQKMTMNDNTGRLIDLDEEKVYEIDVRGKSYKVMTFEEMRRRMQEAAEKASGRASSRESKESAAKPEQGEQNVEIDFDLKESGQRKNINGFDTHEVVMTITVRQKGKTLEEGGGMVMTSNMWMAPRIASMKEIQDFDRRYAEKMQFGSPMAGMEQMATAMAMYPHMKQALGKFQTENVNMNGTAILTTMRMETVPDPSQRSSAQNSQEQRSEDSTSMTPSVRGVLGGLGGFGRRKSKKSDRSSDSSSGAAPAAATPGRSSLFTMNHELVRVSSDVADSDLAIPAGFKEKK